MQAKTSPKSHHQHMGGIKATGRMGSHKERVMYINREKEALPFPEFRRKGWVNIEKF